MIKIDFKSNLISSEDFLIEKPMYLKNLVSVTGTFDNLKYEPAKVKIKGLTSLDFYATAEKEFFINKSKTLFSCSFKFNENNQSISIKDSIYKFFYSPFLDEEKGKEEINNLELTSPYFSLFNDSVSTTLKFNKENFEIIPKEDEIIFNFIIDNSILIKELDKKN